MWHVRLFEVGVAGFASPCLSVVLCLAVLIHFHAMLGGRCTTLKLFAAHRRQMPRWSAEAPIVVQVEGPLPRQDVAMSAKGALAAV